jgi:hypothetical protein
MAEAGGGWSWILSDLETLLETGASLRAEPASAEALRGQALRRDRSRGGS